MGYYTDFILDVEPADEHGRILKTKIPEQLLHDVDDEIIKMNVMESDLFIGNWHAYAKWYDVDDDMLLLSTKFPSLVFHMHGAGENSEDMWDRHYWNGMVQYCPVEIRYDPYDPKLLESEDIKRTEYSYQIVQPKSYQTVNSM